MWKRPGAFLRYGDGKNAEDFWYIRKNFTGMVWIIIIIFTWPQKGDIITPQSGLKFVAAS